MSVAWTKEQRRVIDVRNKNVLVSAAAGSGKTAVLVERILSLITDPEHPVDADRLLVTTFTKAAASQMRERIGKALAERILDAAELYPAHRAETGDLRTRTAELKAHHARRLEDTLRIVGETPGLTAYEIAGRMRWSIRCRSWEDFPLTQKSFAVGEAMAHLDYLEVRGRVCRREIRGKRVYFAGAGDKI